jgi:uncharacterized protein
MSSASPADPRELRRKVRLLTEELLGTGSVVVAFSGGVDSSLLLALAVEALGPDRVLAALAVSPSLAPTERIDAHRIASLVGASLREVETNEMSDPAYAANPEDRCYHCKSHLFRTLREVAEREGYAAVVEGSNVDDDGDYRPGRRSLAELGIASPLRAAGLNKTEIRWLLRERNLPVWDKPAQACLASRVPYGQRLTPERLARIGAAEAELRTLGFRQVRVRDWEALAVVEVGSDELDRLFEPAMRARVSERLRAVGYGRVTLDPEGYRMGSLNEEL